MPAKLELSPLDEGELRLCLTLLSAPLHKRKKRRSLIKRIDDSLRGKPYYLVGRPDDQSKKQPKWLTWKTDAEDALWRVQAEWRSIARGDSVNLDFENFDDALLASPGKKYDIPPVSFRLKRFRNTTIVDSSPHVSIRTLDDLFNWLLVRAVTNKQVSRFAHCVVCGVWELKAIAGRRSNAVVKYAKRYPNRSKWPPLLISLPQWPAVCERAPCRAKFQNALSGRVEFDLKDFAGLRGEGITQMMPGLLPSHF